MNDLNEKRKILMSLIDASQKLDRSKSNKGVKMNFLLKYIARKLYPHIKELFEKDEKPTSIIKQFEHELSGENSKKL